MFCIFEKIKKVLHHMQQGVVEGREAIHSFIHPHIRQGASDNTHLPSSKALTPRGDELTVSHS